MLPLSNSPMKASRSPSPSRSTKLGVAASCPDAGEAERVDDDRREGGGHRPEPGVLEEPGAAVVFAAEGVQIAVAVHVRRSSRRRRCPASPTSVRPNGVDDDRGEGGGDRLSRCSRRTVDSAVGLRRLKASRSPSPSKSTKLGAALGPRRRRGRTGCRRPATNAGGDAVQVFSKKWILPSVAPTKASRSPATGAKSTRPGLLSVPDVGEAERGCRVRGASNSVHVLSDAGQTIELGLSRAASSQPTAPEPARCRR